MFICYCYSIFSKSAKNNKRGNNTTHGKPNPHGQRIPTGTTRKQPVLPQRLLLSGQNRRCLCRNQPAPKSGRRHHRLRLHQPEIQNARHLHGILGAKHLYRHPASGNHRSRQPVTQNGKRYRKRT